MCITFFYTRVTSLCQTQVWLTRLTFTRRNVQVSAYGRPQSRTERADFFPCKQATPRGKRRISWNDVANDMRIERFSCPIDLIEEFACPVRCHERTGKQRNKILYEIFSGVGNGDARWSAGFIRTVEFSRNWFFLAATVAPRVLSPLGKVSFMSWPRAEFPERVVNRIMKTSEPLCVGTPQSFVATF